MSLYFDYAASTPLDPRVKNAMDEVSAHPGNPSSTHAAGRFLRGKIDAARAAVSRLLGVEESEIVFTSGATEANAAAVLGLVRASRRVHPGRVLRVVASAIEHSSVSGALARLADEGIVTDVVPADEVGRVSAAAVSKAITPDTVLVCVMWANNVLGTLQPVAEIGRAVAEARDRRVPGDPPLLFLCDAVQAMSTQPVLPRDHGIDALVLSGHKMYGPKGVGALYVRRGTPFEPLIPGGGQESGRRSGTENVAGIVGLGRAAELLESERAADADRAVKLRATLVQALSRIPGVTVFGEPANSLPGTIFLAGREDGDIIALKCDAAGAAVSAGSACDAGTRKRSAALLALKKAAFQKGGIRISFGRFTTPEEAAAWTDVMAAVMKGGR